MGLTLPNPGCFCKTGTFGYRLYYYLHAVGYAVQPIPNIPQLAPVRPLPGRVDTYAKSISRM
ncbi:hypothetical protein KAH81_05745 [bacterium]|nr:hypothetical protein [bacterium]